MTVSKLQPKSVYEFIDYRKFLEFHYQEKKQRSSKFSFRYFAMKAGIASPSYLKMVMDGKRNLTSATIEKFCHALELDGKESKYFINLVHFNQAKTAREKQEYYLALRTMGSLVKEEVLRVNQYDYFDKWYTPILRELICLGDFQDNFELLGRSVEPSITALEAKAALQLLIKLNLVTRKEGGAYAQTKKAITVDDSVTSMALRSYQENALRHAMAAMHNQEKQIRHISTMTLGVSASAYAAMVEEILAFKDRIKSLVHKDEASSRVYQFTLALFPVTKDTSKFMDAPAAKLVTVAKPGAAARLEAPTGTATASRPSSRKPGGRT